MRRTIVPTWIMLCAFIFTTLLANYSFGAAHNNYKAPSLKDNSSIRKKEKDVGPTDDAAVFFALTPAQCDSLVERVKVNISVGNNCQTEILPEYIFANGGFIPTQSDIDRYEYVDTSGAVRTDSIIPSYFTGTCLNVTAYVQGCALTGSGSLIPYSAMLCLEDKDPPNITCAPTDTISCIEASQRIFTGFVADCGEVDTLLLDENIEELASGPFIQRISRIWQLRDEWGNLSDTCSQLVLVRRLDFVNQLSIPTDTLLSCDDVGGIDVPIPPTVSGQVIIEGMPIGEETKLCNTAAFYEDQILINSLCKKVTLRKWTINEWRAGRDNIIERMQMITVTDTVAPLLSGLPDTIRVSTTGNTCFADVDLPAITFSEVCNPSSVKVDIFTPTGALIDQNGGIVSLPVDTNQVFYSVSDPCHHITRDTLIVIVTDMIGPLTICESTMSISIPSAASDIVVPADQFDINSVDACGGTITKQVRHMDSTILSNQITFDCDDIGDTIMVVLQVSDERGNASTCMIRTSINGDTSLCVSNQALIVNTPIANTHQVAGLVFSDLGIGIPGVELRTTEGELAETDLYGNYIFNPLEADQSHMLSVDFDTDFGVGVSTFDLLGIQRHIIGLEPIGDKYRLIAADINNDKEVNAIDLVLLRKHILGLDSGMNDQESWRFVSESNDKEPMGQHHIENLTDDIDVDFVGIKIGDVTGDAIDDLLTSSRSNAKKMIVYDIIDLGGYREVSFKASEAMKISGVQALIRYNDDLLSLTNVSGAKLSLSNGDYNGNSPGLIRISWAGDHDKVVKKGEVLWRILLESSSGNEWNYGITFEQQNDYLRSEVYVDGESFDLVLERAMAPSEELSEIKSEPNPWHERTKLSFDLPRDGMVELELYDASNRLVLNKTKIFDTGFHEWILSNTEISQGGVYFGKMSFEGKTRVFKIIKLE